MNSIADIKKFEEQRRLEKAKQKVVDALSKEPLGLSIAQLMTICQLSIKTVKNVLAVIKAEQEDGVFFLKSQITPGEQEQITESKEASQGVRDATKRLANLLASSEEGFTREQIIKSLSFDDRQFSNAMYRVRKLYNIKQIGKRGEYRYALANCEKNQQSKPAEFIEQPLVVEVATDSVVVPEIEPVPEVKAEQPAHPLDEYKAKVKTVVTRKSELTLKEDELGVLLSDLFGLANVQFCVDGGRLVGVRLFEEVVA